MSNVKSKTKTRPGIPDLDIPNSDETTTNDEEKANTLRDYFGTVFTREDENNIPEFEKVTENILSKLEITKEDIFKKLSKLKTSKSPGPDGIHPRVLQELSEELVEPLHLLF